MAQVRRVLRTFNEAAAQRRSEEFLVLRVEPPTFPGRFTPAAYAKRWRLSYTLDSHKRWSRKGGLVSLCPSRTGRGSARLALPAGTRLWLHPGLLRSLTVGRSMCSRSVDRWGVASAMLCWSSLG